MNEKGNIMIITAMGAWEDEGEDKIYDGSVSSMEKSVEKKIKRGCKNIY